MEVRLMEYEPDRRPERKNKPASDIHHDINDLTGGGFDGIAVRDGFVTAISGDLDDSDVDAIENYLSVPISTVHS